MTGPERVAKWIRREIAANLRMPDLTGVLQSHLEDIVRAGVNGIRARLGTLDPAKAARDFVRKVLG